MQELEKGARQYPEDDEGLGISIEDALHETSVQLGRLTMLGDRPVHGAGVCGPGGPGGGGAGGKGLSGALAAAAERRAGEEGGGGPRNVVVSRDEMKALSSALVAKRTKAAKAKGEAGNGALGDDRSENTTVPPVRGS